MSTMTPPIRSGVPHSDFKAEIISGRFFSILKECNDGLKGLVYFHLSSERVSSEHSTRADRCRSFFS